jgi:hypothetical protein
MPGLKDPKDDVGNTLPESNADTQQGASQPEPGGPKQSSSAYAVLKKAGEHIGIVAAYGILLTCMGLGATFATIYWSSSYTSLQNDMHHAQDGLRKSQEELEKVRAELQTLKIESAKNLGQASSGNSNKPSPIRPTIVSTPTPSSSSSEVRLEAGQTATIFGDDLRISLIGVQFENNPPRYTVMASVSSPGVAKMDIKDATIGFTASYPDKGGFDIEILKTDTFSATFRVSRHEK